MTINFFTRHADKIVPISECGCWIWIGATDTGGYGQVYCGRLTDAGNKVPEGAHRIAYEATFGPFDQSQHVLHRCDIRSCVNPDHLFLGNQMINMQDMAAKARSCCGENHGMTHLTNEDVIQIRTAYAAGGITYAEIGERFGLKPSTVGAIVRRQSFKYLPSSEETNTAGVTP